jgi:hypothetical protein
LVFPKLTGITISYCLQSLGTIERINYFMLAPIVLFVYNRPDHTRQTVEALQRNELAQESQLFVFSDGPKTQREATKVREVRSYIHSITGFSKINILERDTNWGLANSIIDGVTKIVNQYGKIIALEDDLVSSPYFLQFMNDALVIYENEPAVWHISGWNYPIDPEGLEEVFFWRAMNCTGWATWADRWQYYDKNVVNLIKAFSPSMIDYFDLDNSGVFWKQVIGNKEGELNTWAIFWYASIFLRNGLCLNPARSLIANIGFDGSGVHSGKFGNNRIQPLRQTPIKDFGQEIVESGLAVERIKTYYRSQKRPLYIRMINKLYRWTMGKNLIR